MARPRVLHALFAVLAALVVAAADDASPDARLDEAMRKADVGDPAGALADAQSVLDADPANWRAWNVRGCVHLRAGRLDEADADFVKALELKPRYAPALSNRGIVRARRSDPDGALEWFARALESDPRHARTIVERGRVHREAGRAADARSDFEAATKCAPEDSYAWANLGYLEHVEKRFDAALACYATGLELKPHDLWLLDARARTLAETGRFDETIEALEAAVKHGARFNLRVAARAEAVAKDGALRPAVERLRRREAETLRGLAFREEIAIRDVTRKAAGEAVSSGLDDSRGATRRRDQTKGLARLGLVRNTDDVGAARAEARRQQIGGYYDPTTKSLFVVADGEKAPDRGTVVHELIHALQDQHFSLVAFRKRSIERRTAGVEDEDLLLVTRMVSEGDATFVQTALQVSLMQEQPEKVFKSAQAVSQMLLVMDPVAVANMAMKSARTRGMSDAEIARFEKLDTYAMYAEVSPYMVGSGFVAAVHAKGGWPAVDALYRDPPRTTEQCLHPARFLGKRDEPTPLPFADLEAPAPWRAVDARTFGEAGVLVLFRTHHKPWNETRKVAAGWDGDLLRTWVDESGRAAVAWATTWDTDEEASEFLDAYRDILPSKYPKLEALQDLASDLGCRYACGDAPGSRGTAIQRGREVFLVEGFDEATTATIVEALRARDVKHVD